ncbi:MAG: SDR family NAD(P)-dependent oxidoreductase [Spirochaetota bacterium]|nr:SDR family NAD(P)-dependent oxidoreductase [Spirochaetota bacterium]
MDNLFNFFKDKRILITGAAGTVGKKLAGQILNYEPKELRLLDNNETEMFFLMEHFRDNNRVICYLGSVRDKAKVDKVMAGIDIVFHCAALKHVILSEYNPDDTVQTNVTGVQNIIQSAISHDVKTVIFTSSDKAVNPTNVMGATKLVGEKLITAGNSVKYGKETILSSTRFGNVIGSRGSVVPIFMKQIKSGGPITLTDPEMTRFVMTIEEAATLVIRSAVLARGGEVFITKMPVMKIVDLAEVMRNILAPKYGHKPSDIDIKMIGSKPGEKLYEELMTSEEMLRSIELEEMFVTTPAFKSLYEEINYDYPGIQQTSLDKPYISSNEKSMTQDEIKQYLIEHRIFENLEKEMWDEI